MKANLTVKVIGGIHSGKTALAQAIMKSLRKSALYGVSLQDGEVSIPADKGWVQVLVKTELSDPMLSPDVGLVGPDTVQVSMACLKSAFLVWELQRRNGVLRDPEELAKLPAGQVAENAAEHFWKLLEDINK